jgi:4-amino-4-deoxy-L-arabinose transferase-like glycosyltransferase
MVVAVTGLLIYGYFLASRASYGVGSTVSAAESSGYARMARSILKGEIVQRVTGPDLLGLSNEFDRIFIPLAYDTGPRPGTMAPVYPVGFPMLMALGALIAGWEYGPYLVNPILGLLSIFLIYRAGLELGLSRRFSMAGAIMLAGIPTFIFMSTQPMSDTVAMFWSLAAILAALLSRKRDGWASLAGLAFGMAFLTQSSGVLLLIPILFSLRLKFKNILYFILGGLPTAVIFFTYNGAAYNHQLMAWYWAANHQYPVTITGFIERFNFYRYWIKVTMSPLPLIGWLVVAADRKVEWRNRAILLSWFGAFFLFYSFYDIERSWWNTRLLLPAYPAMILGSLLVARDLSGLLGKRISEVNKARLSWVVLTILLAVTLSHQRRNIRRFDAFNVGRHEIAHYTSCRWADQTIPANSLVAASQMS